MITRISSVSTLLLAGLCFASLSATSASATDTCIGNCGTSGANGVVTAPPGSATYDWVSTDLGQFGVAQIPGFSAGVANGSELITTAFFATAGSKVSFYFNFVTSDGAGFADYAFAQVRDANTSSTVANLFTARTQPSGTIAPGFNLPALEASLTPSSVPIIPGGPVWSPLGGSSGSCYSAGCGYTGWVKSEYTVAADGLYQLRFGAANLFDTAFQTGLAFSGLLLDGLVVGDGSSFESPLLPTAPVNPVTGAFEFTFTPTPNEFVFIDPDYAVGYTYEVLSGPNILKALFPQLSQNPFGYEVYSLGNDLLASNVFGFDFTVATPGGVNGFILKGINVANFLDPTNPAAFSTGLLFANASPVNVTQTPIILNVPGGPAVPEPASWVMLIAGFGLVGAAMRRRRGVAIA